MNIKGCGQFSTVHGTSCKYPYYGFLQHFQIIHKGKIISAGVFPERGSKSQDHPGVKVFYGDCKIPAKVIVFHIQALLSTGRFGSPAAISTQIINSSETVPV